jgi:hypothetical protein
MAPYQVDNIIQTLSILLTIGGIAGGVSLVMYVRARLSGQLSADRQQQLFDVVERLELTVDDLRAEQAALRDDIQRRLGSGDTGR